MNPVKIGFILLSNARHPMPSTRIAVLNMFPFLRVANFEPQIVFEPEPGHETETPEVAGLFTRLIAQKIQIVVFQKVHGPSVEALARQLSDAGVKTVFSVCDLVNTRMAAITDATVVVTDYLRDQYPSELQARIRTVHDGIEDPSVHKTHWPAHCGSRRRPLRAVLVTSAGLDHLPLLGTLPEWLEVTIVGRYPPKLHILQRLREIHWRLADKNMSERWAYLQFLANPRIRCIPWSQLVANKAIRQADIGIIPIEPFPEHLPGTSPPPWKVKSENRLTMKMCAALPVITSPIPAYEPIIQHGVNGFFAQSRADWMACLTALRDPALRRQVGDQARASVVDRYSMNEQASRLINLLRKLVFEAHGERSSLGLVTSRCANLP